MSIKRQPFPFVPPYSSRDFPCTRAPRPSSSANDLPAMDAGLAGPVNSSWIVGAPGAQMGLPARSPVAGSPLINRGSQYVDSSNDVAASGCLARDALWTARPVNVFCDIGAIEVR
jgi:hypothetical protein